MSIIAIGIPIIPSSTDIDCVIVTREEGRTNHGVTMVALSFTKGLLTFNFTYKF